MIKVALFWYLQAQTFYKLLHQEAAALSGVKDTETQLRWADVGCGVGLMSHIADAKGYEVNSYDLDSDMIAWAKFLNRKNRHLTYEVQDVMLLDTQFDVISATSLLSVVDDRKAVLRKLQSLLRNKNSKLILIEPTQDMTVHNV